MPGHYYFCLTSMSIFEIPGCLFAFPCNDTSNSFTRCFGSNIWLCLTDPVSSEFCLVRMLSMMDSRSNWRE